MKPILTKGKTATRTHTTAKPVENNLRPIASSIEQTSPRCKTIGQGNELITENARIVDSYKKDANTEKNAKACILLALYYQHGEGVLFDSQIQSSIEEMLSCEPTKLNVTDINNAAFYFTKAILYEQDDVIRGQYEQLYQNFREEYYEEYGLGIEKHLIETITEANQHMMDLIDQNLSKAKDESEIQSVLGNINEILKDCTIETLFKSLKYCLDISKQKLKLDLAGYIIGLILCKKPGIQITNVLISHLDDAAQLLLTRQRKGECQVIIELRECLLMYSINLLRVLICRPHKLELASELLKHPKTQYEDLVVLLNNWIPCIDDPLKIEEKIIESKKNNQKIDYSEVSGLVATHLAMAGQFFSPESIHEALRLLCLCLNDSKNREIVFLKIFSIIGNKDLILMNNIVPEITDVQIAYLCIYYSQLIDPPLRSLPTNTDHQLINSMNLKNLFHIFAQEKVHPFPEIATLTYCEMVQIAFVYAYEGANAKVPNSSACNRVALFLQMKDEIVKIVPKEFQGLTTSNRIGLVNKYLQKAKSALSLTEKKSS